MARKPTYAELEAEVSRLEVVRDNLWRGLRTERVSHRNDLIDVIDDTLKGGVSPRSPVKPDE